TVDHTVYFKSQPASSHLANSSLITAGSVYTLTFTVQGTYYFYCTLHPYMQGSVTVLASTTPVPQFPASYLALTLFALVAGVILLVPRFRASAPGPSGVISPTS
ncbi:MAG: cupredoxin domain-containing protein, partial [Nitrososphaerales archaeon]